MPSCLWDPDENRGAEAGAVLRPTEVLFLTAQLERIRQHALLAVESWASSSRHVYTRGNDVHTESHLTNSFGSATTSWSATTEVLSHTIIQSDNETEENGFRLHGFC